MEQTRRREPNHKARIVAERGYLNLALNHEDVAEFDYQPGKCRRPYRVVVVRKNISRTRGDQVLFDEIRFYVTTRTDLTATEVVACANDRCDQENVIDNSRTASLPCGSRSTTWSATGPTWSSPPWPGTSSRGSP